MSRNELKCLIEQKPYLKEALDFIDQIISISSDSEADDFSSLTRSSEKEEQLIDPRLFSKQDLTNTMQLYLKLTHFIMEQSDTLKQTYDDLYNQWKNDPEALKSFLLEVLLGDPQNRCLARNEITVFLLKASLRPSFNALIEKSDKPKGNNHCPVCGFPPDMELEGADSENIKLICSFCGNRWLFPENTCPHCNTKDQLTKLKTNEETSISGCNSCKRYFRVITKNELADLDDRYLDIISDHANVFAVDQGFH